MALVQPKQPQKKEMGNETFIKYSMSQITLKKLVATYTGHFISIHVLKETDWYHFILLGE